MKIAQRPSSLNTVWSDGRAHRCEITKTAVFIDGVKLPNYIAERGVTVAEGSDKELNQVTVTFIVGEIEIADDAVPQVLKAGGWSAVDNILPDVAAGLVAHADLEVTKGNEG